MIFFAGNGIFVSFPGLGPEFLDKKLFGPRFFWTQNSSETKCYWAQIGHKFYWIQNLLDPTLFGHTLLYFNLLTQNIPEPNIFVRLNFFWSGIGTYCFVCFSKLCNNYLSHLKFDSETVKRQEIKGIFLKRL